MEHIDAKKAMELVGGADRLPRAKIEALAEERLHFLVDYARTHSPYLKEKYAGLPGDFALSDIPVSTRAEMVEYFDRWVCDPAITESSVREYVSDFENIFTSFLGKYAIASTSGTTAAPPPNRAGSAASCRTRGADGAAVFSWTFVEGCSGYR